MDCPKCGSKTKCVDSRVSAQVPNGWTRRRSCLNVECGLKFTTLEVLSEKVHEVYKQNQSLKKKLATSEKKVGELVDEKHALSRVVWTGERSKGKLQ